MTERPPSGLLVLHARRSSAGSLADQSSFSSTKNHSALSFGRKIKNEALFPISSRCGKGVPFLYPPSTLGNVLHICRHFHLFGRQEGPVFNRKLNRSFHPFVPLSLPSMAPCRLADQHRGFGRSCESRRAKGITLCQRVHRAGRTDLLKANPACDQQGNITPTCPVKPAMPKDDGVPHGPDHMISRLVSVTKIWTTASPECFLALPSGPGELRKMHVDRPDIFR